MTAIFGRFKSLSIHRVLPYKPSTIYFLIDDALRSASQLVQVQTCFQYAKRLTSQLALLGLLLINTLSQDLGIFVLQAIHR